MSAVVPENAPAGTIVTVMEASDPDNDPINYFIIGTWLRSFYNINIGGSICTEKSPTEKNVFKRFSRNIM